MGMFIPPGTSPGAGGGSPGGSGTEIQYRSGATTFGAIAGSSVDPATGNITFSARWISSRNSATGAPAHTMTGTWFTGGTTTTTKPHFLIEPTGATSNNWSTSGTGLGVNAPSGFTGNLLDLQANGGQVFVVGSNATLSRFVTIGFSSWRHGFGANSSQLVIISNDFNSLNIYENEVRMGSTGTFGFCGSSTNQAIIDTLITRDAAGTLAQRNGAAAQTFRVYNTFTSATNHERGKLEWASNVLLIGTEKGTTGGTARGLELQTDGVTRIRIGPAGQLGFFGAAAVAQPAAIPDATDAASTQTGLNSVLAALRSLGWIATQ